MYEERASSQRKGGSDSSDTVRVIELERGDDTILTSAS